MFMSVPAGNVSAASGGGTDMIRECFCTNAYQDARYGANKRVHNPAKKDSSGHTNPEAATCTVCGRRKP